MKIIFVVSALHGGGAERVISILANGFVSHNDVTILMVAGEENVYTLDSKIKLVSIGQASGGNLRVRLKRAWLMRKFFRENPESVIISFTTTINMFTILASVGLKNKVIVSERNAPDRCNYKILRNFIYGLGKDFVFQTEDAMKCFSKKIQKRSIVIPNPVREDLPEPFTGVKEKKIAAVGRLEPQKNHMLLLKAFAGLHKSYPDYQLHIFGQGSLRNELLDMAEKLEIGEAVVFEGFRKDVLEKIRTYSMYVLSSDYEGVSNSLIEAMAIGMICIATDCPIGGSRFCIQDGKNGYLVPVNDAAAMQKRMEYVVSQLQEEERHTLITDKKTQMQELCVNASTVRQTFSKEKIIDMWTEYIGRK